MYCKKCGAVVTGKFCSNCGTRVRSLLEEYRAAERKARRDFKKDHAKTNYSNFEIDLCHLADACWSACAMRYLHDYEFDEFRRFNPNAFDRLDVVREHADELFNKLIRF